MPELFEWGRARACFKTSDQQSTTTTLSNATELLFAVEAGIIYGFEFMVAFQTVALTTGIALAVSVPSPTFLTYEAAIPFAADGAGGIWQGAGTTSGDKIISTGVPAINTPYLARVYGVVNPGAKGNLQLQFCSEVSASVATIKTGSWGVLYPHS